MTTCIAAICGGGRAIALAADKMLGFGHVQSAVGDKILRLHRNWRVLYAGDDTAPAFPIVEAAAATLRDNQNPTAIDVAAAMTAAWTNVRDGRTEAKVLKGRPGWTLRRFFDEGKDHFLPADVARLTDAIEAEELDLELLIAGFDDARRAIIMAMEGREPSLPQRRPHYWAIGSGASNALTFLSYREAKRTTPTRGALALVVEAKYYGELAPIVSEETDVVVMRPDEDDIIINEDDLENILFQKIAIANRPPNMKTDQLELLNDLADLNGIPYVWKDEDSEKLVERPYDENDKPRRPPRQRAARQRRASASTAVPPVSGAIILESNSPSPPRPKRDRKPQLASRE